MTAPLDWRWWGSPRGRVWHRASTASLVPRTDIPTSTLCGLWIIASEWVTRRALDIDERPCARCEKRADGHTP